MQGGTEDDVSSGLSNVSTNESLNGTYLDFGFVV